MRAEVSMPRSPAQAIRSIPKRSLSLATWARHRGRVGGVALEHLHRDRATLGRAHQAEDDLRIVALAVARMAPRGQLAATPGQPGRGQVVQHQRAAQQMLARQAPLDVRLRVVQPVQRPVQIVGAALAQRPARAPARRWPCRHAACGAWPAWRPAPARAPPAWPAAAAAAPAGPSRTSRRTRATGRTEHRRDMAVGQAALDGEDRLGTGYGDAAAQQHLQALDHLSGQARQVGQGALADLAVLSVGLAKQDRGGRVAVGDGLDIHGHRMIA